MRQVVTFELFLGRLFQSNPGFYLKGGFAMGLRHKIQRTTTDLDLATKQMISGQLRGDREQTADALRKILTRGLHKPTDEVDSLFTYEVGEPTVDIQGGGGGHRFPIRMLMGGAEFSKFSVDITVGDFALSGETEYVETRDAFNVVPGLAGPNRIESVNRHQHAYTKPRPGGHPNTRTKDMIDLVILAEEGLDIEEAARFAKAVFLFDGTHDLPDILPPPPESWEAKYNDMAKEVGVKHTLGEAYEIVARM